MSGDFLTKESFNADIVKQKTNSKIVKWFVFGQRVKCMREASEKVIANRESLGNLDKELVVMVKDVDGNIEKFEFMWWNGETARKKKV